MHHARLRRQSAVGMSVPRRSTNAQFRICDMHLRAGGGVRVGAFREAGPRVTRGTAGGLPLAHNFLGPARKPRTFLEASELPEI